MDEVASLQRGPFDLEGLVVLGPHIQIEEGAHLLVALALVTPLDVAAEALKRGWWVSGRRRRGRRRRGRWRRGRRRRGRRPPRRTKRRSRRRRRRRRRPWRRSWRPRRRRRRRRRRRPWRRS